MPQGWRAWTDDDGPLPAALVARAKAIGADPTAALGQTESFPLPGVVTLLRLEAQVWSRDAQGNLVQGCFRVVGIYLPASSGAAASGAAQAPAAPAEDNLTKTVAILTAASLVIGIVASLAAWGSSK